MESVKSQVKSEITRANLNATEMKLSVNSNFKRCLLSYETSEVVSHRITLPLNFPNLFNLIETKLFNDT